MKSPFSTFASHLAKPLFAASLFALILSPQAISQSTDSYNTEGSGNNQENVNPPPDDCCTCITLTLGGDLKPDDKGNYTITISGQVEGGERCEAVNMTSYELSGPSENITGSMSGKNGEITITITSKQAEEHQGEWTLTVNCEPDAKEAGDGSEPTDSNSVRGCAISFELDPCDDNCDSGSCSEDTASTSASQESFIVNIPTSRSFGGLTGGNLRFRAPDFANPGRSALIANVPANFTVNRDGNDLITSVDTGAATLDIAAADGSLLAQDPNAFTITHKDPSDAVFRTTTISFVNDGGVDRFRMDSIFDGATTRHEQTQPQLGTLVLEKGRMNGGTFEPLWQETLVKDHSTPGKRIHRRIIKERPNASAGWETVSDFETTEENQINEWVKTKEVIDPENAALTSTWSYYQPGEDTGGNAATEGLGRLKHHVRYDGYESFHTYSLNQSTTTTPFAGQPDGKLTTNIWDPVARARTITVEAGGHILSKTQTVHTDTSITRIVHTSEGGTLATVTHQVPVDQPFGGRPLRVLHPDGTLTTYDYSFTGTNGVETITERGATTDQETVSQGIRTTTVTNSRGHTILRQVSAIGHGTDDAVFESMAVTQVDALGRPEITAYFPESASVTGETASATGAAWTTTISYSCCGVATETDQHGIPTFHAYDHLQRRIKSNRLGVTTETHYLGLTTETHRRPESVVNALNPSLLGTQATLVGLSIRNLAETVIHSCSPDPSTPNAGALTATTTSTTYGPTGRVVTTFVGGLVDLTGVTPDITPGNHSQTEEHFLDGRTHKTYGVLAPHMVYTYAVNDKGELSTQAYLVGTALRETTTTQSDWAGRQIRTDFADGAFATVTYNSLGQMTASTDPDQVTTLHAYNARGQRVITAIDLNANGQIDYGTDTVQFSETIPALDGSSNPVWLTTSKVWQDGDTNPAAGTTVSTSLRSPDGLASSTQSIGIANPSTSVTNLQGNGDWSTTSTSPDTTYTRTTYTAGLMDISENFASDNTLISSTSMRDASNDPLSGYDNLNRPTHQRDSRTGVSTTAYLSATADVVKSVTDPGNRATSFTYDPRGRRTHVDAPDTVDANNNNLTNITITHYFPDSTVQETTGDQTYRTTYTYDYAQRQKTLTTYGTSTATTTWHYSTTRGFLTRKAYPDGKGTDYTYTPAGRLETRGWERAVGTAYGYDNGGRLETTTYSDNTPDVTLEFDALGRKILETQENRSRIEYTYNPITLGPDTETISYDLDGNGTLDFTRVLHRSQDGLNRDEGWQLKDGATVENQVTYGYDPAGRLQTVADASNTFTYGYRYNQNTAVDPRVGSTSGTKQDFMPYTLTKSGSPALQTTRTYEATRNALASIENNAGVATRSSYVYQVNQIGQRTGLTTAFDLGGSHTSNPGNTGWGYDNLGQLKSAAAPGTDADRYFSYDGIGNRFESRIGTATDSGGTLTEYFGALTPATVPGANNLNQYLGIKTGATTIEPGYDDDGNATAYPVPAYPTENSTLVWDAENRLISSTVNSITTTRLYDAQSRRIATITGSNTTLYIYDGWNCIAEWSADLQSASLTQTRIWGMDLSGSMQGAGGVGGLLAEKQGSDYFYPTFDGNGNISEYLAADGSTAAHFEYDPFGNIVVNTDSSNQFAYRFSTKPLDSTTGFYYYGYRYYDPSTGRWPSRDPIGEKGGMNVYGMIRNNTVNQSDYLGLKLKKVKAEDYSVTEVPRPAGNHGEDGQTSGTFATGMSGSGLSIWYSIKLPGALELTAVKYVGAHERTEDHERKHIEIFVKNWNSLVDQINWIEKRYCKCGSETFKWAAALVALRTEENYKENLEFDLRDYEEGTDTTKVKSDLATASASIIALKATHDAALQARKDCEK